MRSVLTQCLEAEDWLIQEPGIIDIFSDIVIARDLDADRDVMLVGMRVIIYMEEYCRTPEEVSIGLLGYRGEASLERLQRRIASLREIKNNVELHALWRPQPFEYYVDRIPPGASGRRPQLT